jgi:hypothetical protein
MAKEVTMTWRPEGWSDYLREQAEKWNRNPPAWTFDKFIEFGADAMLEALKDKGAWMTPEQMKLLAPDRKYPYGWLVFIPDEETH